MLEVKRMEKGVFSVIGENVDVVVNTYSSKVNGKGARNHKQEILNAVGEFLSHEAEQDDKRFKELSSQFKKSVQLDLFSLYECEVYHEASYGESAHVRKSIRTGQEVTDSNEYVLSAKKLDVANDSWFIIGGYNDTHYTRLAQSDERFIIVLNSVYVTGLTAKELINEGHKTYGQWRIATPWDVERVLQARDNNQKVVSLIPMKQETEAGKWEMASRIKKEIQRAKNTHEIVKQNKVVGYTKEGQAIRRGWFASKPCSIEEVKKRHCATYDTYAAVKKFTVDRGTFELFEISLDMSLLPEVFEGGTGSTKVTGEMEQKDWIKWTEEEKSLFISGAYRLCAEIVCSDFDYSILVDPQGYDYPRYVAVKE